MKNLPPGPGVPQIHDKKGCRDRLGAYQLADIPSLCCPPYCMVKTLSICLGRSRVGCASRMDDWTICQGMLGGLSLTSVTVSASTGL